MYKIKNKEELENYLKIEYGNRLDNVDKMRFNRDGADVKREDIKYPCILSYQGDVEYSTHTSYHYEVIYPGDFDTKKEPTITLPEPKELRYEEKVRNELVCKDLIDIQLVQPDTKEIIYRWREDVKQPSDLKQVSKSKIITIPSSEFVIPYTGFHYLLDEPEQRWNVIHRELLKKLTKEIITHIRSVAKPTATLILSGNTEQIKSDIVDEINRVVHYANATKKGPPTYIITNLQIAAMLNDIEGYKWGGDNAMIAEQIYQATKFRTLDVYVDCNQTFDDLTIILGRQTKEGEQGIKLFIQSLMQDQKEEDEKYKFTNKYGFEYVGSNYADYLKIEIENPNKIMII